KGSGEIGDDVAGDFKIGVDVLGVVVVVQGLVEPHEAAGGAGIGHGHGDAGKVGEVLRFRGNPLGVEGGADGEELVLRSGDEPFPALVAQVIGPGFQGDFEKLVLGEG